MAVGPPKPNVLDQALRDALGSFPDGLNMGVDPLLLSPTQLSLATNVTVRGTFISHRPPFNKLTLVYAPTNLQSVVEGGIYQGGCYYKPDTGNETLIASISGRQFKFTISGTSCTVTEITPSSGAANVTAIQSWMWQSENFAIREDGVSTPTVHDGTASRTAYNGTDVLGYLGTAPPAPIWAGPNTSATTTGGTVPARGSLVLNGGAAPSHDYQGANNKFIFASWQTAGPIQQYAVLLVTAHAAGSLTVQNPTGADIVLANPTTLVQGGNSVPYPDIGVGVSVAIGCPNVNASGAYDGAYGIIVQAWYVPAADDLTLGRTAGVPQDVGRFQILAQSPIVGTFQNAKLTNVNDTAGTTIAAGTAIYSQTTSQQYVQVAQLSALIRVLHGQSVNATVSPAYLGSNGDSIAIGGVACTVNSGAGTTTINITNNGPDSQWSAGTSVARLQTVTTNQTIGVLVQPFTVPTANDTTPAYITLQNKYLGPNGAACFIGTKSYHISQYSSVTSAQAVTLVNTNIDPTNRRFVNNADGYVYFSQMPEIPVGRMGVYANGRTWVVLADGRSYWASDLVGESSGTPPSFRDAVIKGTTNNYLFGGGAFSVPGTPADVRAIFGTAQLNAALGQGPVMVGTPTTVYSNQAPADRTTWQNLNYPIQSVSLIGNGPLSQVGTISINGDTLFRSPDGFRSLIMAQRDFDVWGNVPISREIGPLIAGDTDALLDRCPGIQFDNRGLWGINPVSCAKGVFHTSLLALDFDPLSSMRGKQPSVWEGSWTGLNTFQLLTGSFQGASRAFSFHYNIATDKIELWEITKTGANQYYDNNDSTQPITLRFEGPGMNFGQSDPRTRKLLRLIDGEIYTDQMVGTVSFKAFYKPDQYPVWVPWLEWSQTADVTVTPNFRPRVGLSEPSARSMDVSTNRPLREAYTYQFALEITGQCRFRGARFWAVPIPEQQSAPAVDGAIAGVLNPQ